QRCQDVAYESLADHISLLVHENEEERFVLDDRSTETNAKLVTVFVILLDAEKIVEPLAGVQRGVAVCPKCAAAERVCSRSRYHLHLPGTASDLGIHRRGDDTHLLDQIGARVRAGQRAIVVPAVSDVEAVPRHIHGAESSTGKIAVKVVFG